MTRRLPVVLLIAILVQAAAPAQPQKPRAPARGPEPANPALAGQAATIMVSNSLGFLIQKGSEQDLTVAEEPPGWTIHDGETKLKPLQIKKPTDPVDRKLRIERFAPTDGTVMVKVNVSPKDRDEKFNLALYGADRLQPLTLVDSKGRKYTAVGFVYKDPSIVQIRYTRASALTGLSQVPSVSWTTPDRESMLLFLVNLGAEVTEFRVGNKLIEKYDPAVRCDQKQK